IGLDGRLARSGQRGQQSLERRGGEKRRRPAAEEDRLELLCEHRSLPLELPQERVDVAAMLLPSSHDRDEVAVAAAMRAERNMYVEVANSVGHRDESPRLSTARKASCGTSTAPTRFIRFFPAFCFSSSFRFRVMSPP